MESLARVPPAPAAPSTPLFRPGEFEGILAANPANSQLPQHWKDEVT